MTAKNDHMAQKARVSKTDALETISTHEPAFKEACHCKLQIPEKYNCKPGPTTGRRMMTKAYFWLQGCFIALKIQTAIILTSVWKLQLVKQQITDASMMPGNSNVRGIFFITGNAAKTRIYL